MMLMAAIGMPLLSLIFRSDRWLLKRLTAFMILYEVIFLIPTTFMNDFKPLVPYKLDLGGLRYAPRKSPGYQEGIMPYVKGVGWSHLIVNKDRLGLRHLMRPYKEMFLRRYESMVPPYSTVGVILHFRQWDYVLFGKGFTRKIIPLNHENMREIEDRVFDYIVATETELALNPDLKKIIDQYYLERGYLDRTFPGNWPKIYSRKE